ncbi:Bardet-Biedl syndrome 7 protein homolog isoform X10 [Dreissena polymorpha]|uniref:Bardet-Biedl syndrome 7 protein homolog isoform X10 n=1 Tax=Dreissena polymorpha TaxID=45954 RepID=UPI0022655549|nr:Bardet-Biedl syndrome 7 protein homolog isoform X10 [Dreissena polymorpha]
MMEISLTRVDYTQVGVTSPKCLRLLPLAGKTQKAAIADHKGVLEVFSVKKGDAQPVFKTTPGPKINRLELGGPVGGVRERIFVTSGPEVKGYTKKGKNFLTFDTNMSENLLSMYVEGSDLFCCGQFMYNHYRDCKDTNYFLSGDQVNDVICLPTQTVKSITPILACQDRVLRVLTESELLYEVEVPGPPVTLCLFASNGGDDGTEVLFGTSDGRVGLVQIGRDCPSHLWELTNEKRNGGVLCLDNFDITADGVLDLIVGRDDGLVEVYSYDDSDEPIHRHTHTCSESITSVQGGILGTAGYDEIVCSTYAGWVLGLTTEQQTKALGPTEVITSPVAVQKITGLKTDLEQLQQKVMSEREKYQQTAQSTTAISAVPSFHINDKFVLNREDASYTLSLELQMPIDNVLLQVDQPRFVLYFCRKVIQGLCCTFAGRSSKVCVVLLQEGHPTFVLYFCRKVIQGLCCTFAGRSSKVCVVLLQVGHPRFVLYFCRKVIQGLCCTFAGRSSKVCVVLLQEGHPRFVLYFCRKVIQGLCCNFAGRSSKVCVVLLQEGHPTFVLYFCRLVIQGLCCTFAGRSFKVCVVLLQVGHPRFVLYFCRKVIQGLCCTFAGRSSKVCVLLFYNFSQNIDL